MLEKYIERQLQRTKEAQQKHTLAIALGQRWPEGIEPATVYFPDQTAAQRVGVILPVCATIDVPVWPLVEAFPPSPVCIAPDSDTSLNLGEGPQVYPVWVTAEKHGGKVMDRPYLFIPIEFHWYSGNVKFTIRVNGGAMGFIPDWLERVTYQGGHVKYWTEVGDTAFENFLKGESC